MSEEKCLSCKEKSISHFYGCDICHNGVCIDCGEKIEKEISDLLSKTYCKYCTTDFDKFCEDCKDHVFNWFEDYKNEQKKGTKIYVGIKNFQDVDINIEFVRNDIQSHNCRCNDNCHCYQKVRNTIKKKYGVEDFSIWEVKFNNLKCGNCLDKENNQKCYGGSFIFIEQDRDGPCF